MAWIDKQLVLDIVGNDPVEARRLLALFFDSAREQVSKLRAGLLAEDMEQANTAAHQLAGAAGTCGIMLLSERLRALEQLTQTDPPTDFQPLVAEIEDLLRQAEEEAALGFAEDSAGTPS